MFITSTSYHHCYIIYHHTVIHYDSFARTWSQPVKLLTNTLLKKTWGVRGLHQDWQPHDIWTARVVWRTAKPTSMDDSQSTFELSQVSKESSAQTEKTFKQFYQQILNFVVSPSDISTSHCLGKSQTSGPKLCPMIVRLTNRTIKIAIANAKYSS